MLVTTRLLAIATLAVGLANAFQSPADRPSGVDTGEVDYSNTQTDTATIIETAKQVDQKAGPTADSVPDQPPADTVVTAVDGEIKTEAVPSVRRSLQRRIPGRFAKRLSGYQQVFAGTGTGASDRDASIQGTAYLTFTTIPDATYDVDACQAFCNGIPQCVFVNLFYERENPGLDATGTNLKCAAYADVHSAAEKTNFGGQQQYPPESGHGVTYIQHSSGWAKTSLTDPETPEGYELVFGPIGGATNANGYMGFAFLSNYDVNACAALCNTRGADGQGGVCQFFNIWRAVVNGDPTTYSCAMYFLKTDASTATNTGQDDLKVTFSRGYARKDYIVDGGFEGYNCGGGSFCFAESYSNWVGTSSPGGTLDATFFHYQPYARTGSGSGLLGSATGADALAGEIAPAAPLNTVSGKTYNLQFWQNSAFSGPTNEADSFVDVYWNGVKKCAFTPGYQQYTRYECNGLVAAGNDVVTFKGGKAPAWSFLDDVSLFLA